jgi:hypothetical protein
MMVRRADIRLSVSDPVAQVIKLPDSAAIATTMMRCDAIQCDATRRRDSVLNDARFSNNLKLGKEERPRGAEKS